MAAEEVYEVLVVKYGTRSTHRSDVYLNYPLYGEPDAPTGMDYFLWIARNERNVVIIDTGFSPQGGAARNRTMLIDPRRALELLGITPGIAPTVAITHAHYDHIGNLDHFPESTVVIAESEYAFWAGRYGGHPLFHHSVEDAELAVLVAAAAEGRVSMFTDSVELAPGIEMSRLGGHTPGQSVVLVPTADGTVLLASDAIHYYEEYERSMPFSSVTGVLDMCVAFDRIRSMLGGGRAAHLVSGHDPATPERLGKVAVPRDDPPELAGLVLAIGAVRPGPGQA